MEHAPVYPLDATNTDAALLILRPHMRKIIEAADPGMLGAFEAAYDDAAADAADELINGPADLDELAGDQAVGLRAHIATNLVAFVVNVAASLAVANVQAAHPDVWKWLVQSAVPPAPAGAKSSDPVVRLFSCFGASEAERARAEAQFRCDPILMQTLDSKPPP